MYTILVAGAGHGGLAAAAILAKAGHRVTVIEKKQESALGHDWEDRFSFDILADILGLSVDALPADIWRYRGDCTFVSPDMQNRIPIHYTAENRQKIMWRAPLIQLLVEHAKSCGVQFLFSTAVIGPVTDGGRVCGLLTEQGRMPADLVIDAAGVFSPVRSNLPEEFGIEKSPKHGDLFYACRTYFDRLPGYPDPSEPFEVYLCHKGEPGLCWFCTNEDSVDVLVGLIDPLSDEQIQSLQAGFRVQHPWMGSTVLHGGQRGFIPVRRPLTIMVANGYAAVGDSAFMTTPMNGMGIDLSLQAGKLLAQTVLHCQGILTTKKLWKYNRDYHRKFGASAAKNDALKSTILTLPQGGLDFLFAQGVVQASDLAGGEADMSVSALYKKISRGVKRPDAFLMLINGIIRGRMVGALYKNAPSAYAKESVRAWSESITSLDTPL